MNALELQGATARLGKREVLHDVDLSLTAGEVVGVIGPNGAGKTTLLRAALGLLPLTRGKAHLGGQEVRGLTALERAGRVGYLPQERRLAWGVAAWRAASLGSPSLPPGAARAGADQALARVGLSGLESRSVFAMSGGERARVLLARLLMTRAPVLVADEPAAGLDPAGQIAALEILRAEANRDAAVLLTLHDLTLAARFCDRLVVLREGRIVADAPPAGALSTDVLRTVFELEGELIETSMGPLLATRRSATKEKP